MKNYRFIISGIVQGVYYRKSIQENASKANFSGYVKNLPNRDVEAATTCEENKLESFINILKKGSPQSKVDTIQTLSSDETFSGGFTIRY